MVTGGPTIDRLRDLLASPHLIDLILVFTLIEAVVVVVLRGLSTLAMGRMLLPGICLMLAIRAVLAGAGWPWVPVMLTVALMAHLFDLRDRWRR